MNVKHELTWRGFTFVDCSEEVGVPGWVHDGERFYAAATQEEGAEGKWGAYLEYCIEIEVDGYDSPIEALDAADFAMRVELSDLANQYSGIFTQQPQKESN